MDYFERTLNIILDIGLNIPVAIWLLVPAFLIIALAMKHWRSKHASFRRKADRQLKMLISCETPQEKFYQLRKTNPFVFEEMILTALKNKGHKIKRNKRYTGDGGIDGQVFIDKKHYLIQAKRYRTHINPAHVNEFISLCNKRGSHGLFVHTGKTGAKSKDTAHNTNLEIVSGTRLLNLLDSNISDNNAWKT